MTRGEYIAVSTIMRWGYVWSHVGLREMSSNICGNFVYDTGEAVSYMNTILETLIADRDLSTLISKLFETKA